MKVKYLSLFAAIALISFGGVVGCGGSDATKTDGEGEATEAVDPCAGADPCAAKSDPCAAAADPCAAAADPCAAAADPCAGN